MTQRKPRGVSWESWIDRQVREGRERGEFDNLPGAGRPLADLDRPHDEMWWVRKKLVSEGVSYLPPALALRKDKEEAMARLAHAPSEEEARRMLEELNDRIKEMNRRGASGPPSDVMPVDVDRAVARWHQGRSDAVLEQGVPPEAPGVPGYGGDRGQRNGQALRLRQLRRGGHRDQGRRR